MKKFPMIPKTKKTKTQTYLHDSELSDNQVNMETPGLYASSTLAMIGCIRGNTISGIFAFRPLNSARQSESVVYKALICDSRKERTRAVSGT